MIDNDNGTLTEARERRDQTDAPGAMSDSYGDGQPTATITSRIAHGTERLTEEARQRVIAARQAAISAARSTRAVARQGQRTAVDFFENQPLVVGALAVAVGAAIGGLIPRSKLEDDTLGDRSDALFARAERIFDEERQKMATVAAAVADEASETLDEKKRAINEVTGDKTLVETTVDEAKRAGSRVAEKAVKVAKSENLGKPTV
ncbi:MAG: hypothetical protein HC844_02355 [Tabrizicola sp.]|nr:hypothetical protein [Tabrizicola sp.]